MIGAVDIGGTKIAVGMVDDTGRVLSKLESVLGGSVMKSATHFLDGIRKVVSQGCRFVPVEKTELALASLGEDANLIAAARVWHHRFRQVANNLKED